MNSFPTINPERMSMKPFLFALLLSSVAGRASAFEQPKIYDLKPNDRVIVLGDSTTYEGTFVAGHVRLVDQAQKEQIPDKNVIVYGFGWAQNETAALLGERGQINVYVRSNPPKYGFHPHVFLWDAPWKDGRPTVAIINMGLNDSKAGDKVIPAYVEILRKAVLELRELKVFPILCATTTWGGLKQTKGFAEAARALAKELDCPLIDLYAAHAQWITEHTKDGTLPAEFAPTRDGVHLSSIGETLSATTFLQALGLKPEWKQYQVRVTTYRKSKGEVDLVVTADPPLPAPKTPYAFRPFWPNMVNNMPLVPPGTRLTLEVKPRAGYSFYGWQMFAGQPLATATNTITLTVDRHLNLEAFVLPSDSADPVPQALQDAKRKLSPKIPGENP
jgi:hypothetical protein